MNGRLAAAALACLLATGADATAGDRCAPADGLTFLCGAVGVEDVARLPGTRWLIGAGLSLGAPTRLHRVDTVAGRVTAMPVSFAASTIGDCPKAPDPRRWSMDGVSIGIGTDGRLILFAANHGDRQAVEMFRITLGAAPTAQWIGCALMPPGTLPNGVAALPDGGVIASSFLAPGDPQAWARMARGEPTGSLWEWHAGRGFRRIRTAPISGANGLALSADARLLYVSAWAESRLIAIDRRTGRRRAIALGFRPDNIVREPRGTLLVAGQRADILAIGACGPQCPQPWTVARVDPVRGTITRLLERPGTAAVNYAATALPVGDMLYLTLRGDRRIARIPLRDLPSLH